MVEDPESEPQRAQRTRRMKLNGERAGGFYISTEIWTAVAESSVAKRKRTATPLWMKTNHNARI